MTTPQQLVARVLAADHDLVRGALKRAIPDAEPRRYLYDLITAYLARSGKGFRSSLCLATCRAFGGRSQDALDAAVALELLHNAFLVHDDIEDGSTLRRGQPALHHAHGVALALNAGDGMCALALTALSRCASRQPASVAGQLLAETAHLFRRSVEGQAWELGWILERCFDLDENDYLRMVLGKTCWYSTIHPCRLGALIGSRGGAALDALVPFGLYLGAAFQIRDDLDNLAPGSDSYGKNARGDLVEGKRTIPLLHLLANSSAERRAEVTRLLDPSDQAPPDRVERLLRWMVEAGSLEYARDVADAFGRMALEQIPRAFAGAQSRTDVEYISSLVLFLTGALEPGAPPQVEAVLD